MSRIVKVAGLAAVVIAVLVVALEVWIHRPLEAPEPPAMSVYVYTAPSRPESPPDLQRRVFLDVNASSPAQVFSGLAQTIGCTLELGAGIDEPVTLRVSNITARTALNAVCESIGCRWELAGTVLKVEAGKRPPPIPVGRLMAEKMRVPLPASMTFKAVPFGEALDAISRTTGVGFTVERVDPKTPVTVDVSEDTPLQAVMKLVYAAGWRQSGRMVPSWNGRLTLRFTPDGKHD